MKETIKFVSREPGTRRFPLAYWQPEILVVASLAMEDVKKPQCNTCGHDEFILVGSFVVSRNGVPYQPVMSLSALEAGDYALTKELLECKGCSHRALLQDCKNGDAPLAIRWETTDRQTRRPIVCPLCKNGTHFIRTVIRSFTVLEYVKIENCEITEVESGDETQLDEVTIRYTCNTPDCQGVVELRSADYRLTKS